MIIINLFGLGYIYPECIKRYRTNNIHSGDWWDESYEEYYTCPIIETLFYEQNSLFLQLVNKLIEKNNDALYLALQNAVLQSDVKKEKLYSFDWKILDKISSALNKMKEHGDKLANENIEKGKSIQSIHASLRKMLDDARDDRSLNPYDLSGQFKILQFKLKFVDKLHSKDSELSNHRGYKKIADVILGLLSGGLLHLANYLITGEAAFFSKTASEEKSSDVQKELGFDCKIELNHNNKP